MRVALVAPAPVPDARGGAERAWEGLRRGLTAAGHDAVLVRLPFPERTLPEVVDGYRRFAALDLTGFDLAVSSKYPAWMARHPRHVVWMFHPLRGVYDTYRAFRLPTLADPAEPVLAELVRFIEVQPPQRAALDELWSRWDAALAAVGPDHPDLGHPSPIARVLIRWLDQVALAPGEIHRHLALSSTIASRPDYFPAGVVPRVVYCPSDLAVPAERSVPADGGGPRLFTTSRLDGPKRIDLIVRAMAHVPGPTPLLIGGTGPEESRLRALAAPDPRIRFIGHASDAALDELYATATAVPFVPLDEDYGLITLEAFARESPVVTCTDSGGPTELVVDGVTGLVTAPNPAAVGAALARLVADPAVAGGMGRAGRRRVAGVTWERVVAAVLGDDPPGRPTGAPAAATAGPAVNAYRAATTGRRSRGVPRRRRRRVVVTSTYRVSEPRHGGQLRCFHLYGALARHADVEVVALVDRPEDAGTTDLGPGFREVRVARTPSHREADEDLSAAVGVPVSDIVAGTHIGSTPEYLARLGRALRGADAVLLAHPYGLHAVEACGSTVSRVYDAHNVEAVLKAGMFPDTWRGRRMLEEVRAVEGRAARTSAVLSSCSDEDAWVLRSLYGTPPGEVVVIPNGTDCDVVVPSPAERLARRRRWLERWHGIDPSGPEMEHVAVFFASWHPPNLEAAEVLLALAPQLPEVLFVLGGTHGDAFTSGPALARLGIDRVIPPNVVFTGVVPDRTRDTLLGLADVALNPMLSGSGTNLKVIEYLAHATPVVSTDFGVRGLDLRDGEHLLVSSVDGLAEAVQRVLGDHAGSARRAAAGRRRVAERYDWHALGDRLAQAIDHALTGA